VKSLARSERISGTVRPSAAGLVLAALLVLVGCTPNSEPDAAPVDGSSTSSGAALTLREYYVRATGGESSAESAARDNAIHAEIEGLIAQCMNDEGFDYAPDTRTYLYVEDLGDYRPDDRDWVEQYGYGMIENARGLLWQRATPGEIAPDPNADYVGALTSAEFDAYQRALRGVGADDGQLESFDYFGRGEGWEDFGCQGSADHEWRFTHSDPTAQFAPLLADIEEFLASEDDALLVGDPQLFDAEWAVCMANAGYPGMQRQSEAWMAVFNVTVNTPEGIGLDPDDPDDAALIRQWVDLEVAQALADLDCRESTNYADRKAAFIADLEAGFIADHRNELDALQAAAEQYLGGLPIS
jgi:hypothetical protein